MESVIREYDAKLDSKKRLTLREAGYEYYPNWILKRG